MQQDPGSALSDLVRSSGPEGLDDPRRVRAMLRDAAPEARLEVSLLVAAVEEGVGQRLARSSGGLLGGEIERLSAEPGLPPRAVARQRRLGRPDPVLGGRPLTASCPPRRRGRGSRTGTARHRSRPRRDAPRRLGAAPPRSGRAGELGDRRRRRWPRSAVVVDPAGARGPGAVVAARAGDHRDHCGDRRPAGRGRHDRARPTVRFQQHRERWRHGHRVGRGHGGNGLRGHGHREHGHRLGHGHGHGHGSRIRTRTPTLRKSPCSRCSRTSTPPIRSASASRTHPTAT